MLICPAYPDVIDPEVWKRAMTQLREYPGMAGCYLKWHPYRCQWSFKIDWSDSSNYEHSDPDVNKAILAVVERMEAEAEKLRAERFK